MFFQITSDSFYQEWMYNATVIVQLCLVKSPSFSLHLNVSPLALFYVAEGNSNNNNNYHSNI